MSRGEYYVYLIFGAICIGIAAGLEGWNPFASGLLTLGVYSISQCQWGR